MTKIEISYKNKNIIKVVASEHADYAEYGKDIVCAGISSILQTAELGLQKFSKVQCTKKQGYMSMQLVDIENSISFNNAQIILQTMLCGLEDLQKQYPKHLKLEVK